MERNNEYRQIILHGGDGSHLSGKVVDRFAFSEGSSYNTSFLVVTFTDKTYIAVGIEYDENREPLVDDYRVEEPWCIDSGCFDCHSWVGSDGKLHFDKWIQVLKDLNLWNITEDEAKEVIERKRKEYRKREYEEYLRLKEKFEGKEVEI